MITNSRRYLTVMEWLYQVQQLHIYIRLLSQIITVGPCSIIGMLCNCDAIRRGSNHIAAFISTEWFIIVLHTADCTGVSTVVYICQHWVILNHRCSQVLWFHIQFSASLELPHRGITCEGNWHIEVVSDNNNNNKTFIFSFFSLQQINKPGMIRVSLLVVTIFHLLTKIIILNFTQSMHWLSHDHKQFTMAIMNLWS